MKIIIIHSLLVATTINAEPLKIVEAAPSEVSREKSQVLHDTLQAKIPEARISMQQVSSILDATTLKFLPNGQLFRLSAVVMDPETRHGALINFVIYEQDNKQIVMPMSGSHAEFADLLKLAGKKINDRNDALAISRGYVAIYGIKFDAEPEIDFDGKSFVIRILQSSTALSENKRNTLELKISVDKEHNAGKVEAKFTD